MKFSVINNKFLNMTFLFSSQYNRCKFFLVRTIANVKLVCPAGEARPGGALAQALGPHHVKPSEFAAEFNKKTTLLYSPGLPLGCRLVVATGGKFTLQVCPPSYTTLTLGADNILGYTELWHILLYRGQGVQPCPQQVRTLLGVLKSFQKSIL